MDPCGDENALQLVEKRVRAAHELRRCFPVSLRRTMNAALHLRTVAKVAPPAKLG